MLIESEHNIAREDKEVSRIGMESKVFPPEVLEKGDGYCIARDA